MNYLNDTHKKISLLDYTIFFGAIAFFTLKVIYSSGELSPDSIQYLSQAQNLWDFKANFPLGYSLFIKMISLFTGSLFISSKLVNLLSYIGVVLFSYRKNFFLPHTILIFSFYPLINMYPLTSSEPLYYLINYLIIYYTYQYIQNGFSIKDTVILFILSFILVSVRFSGIFVIVSLVGFLIYFNFKRKESLKALIFPAVAVSAGGILYLIVNYFYSGFFLGARDHLHLSPAPPVEFLSKIFQSTLQDFSFLNMIIHKGVLSRITSLHIFVSAALLVLFIFIIFKKRKDLSFFNLYLIFSFIGITLGILYSYYTTAIDHSIRVKSNAYLYLIFFIFLNLPTNSLKYIKIFTILILGLNIITIFKYSESILSYRSRFNKMVCTTKEKTAYITYKNVMDLNETNHSSVLLFQAYLIDKGYSIQPSTEQNKNAPGCHYTALEIIHSK